jgi:hypothetical protein
MLAEERDLLIPSPLTDQHGTDFPWPMVAVAVALFVAAVVLYRWLLWRTREQE